MTPTAHQDLLRTKVVYRLAKIPLPRSLVNQLRQACTACKKCKCAEMVKQELHSHKEAYPCTTTWRPS